MAEKLGLYVHIPFCRSKCDYCDFYSLAGKEGRMDDYQKALLAHMKETAPLTRGWQVDTVYFGGGTPSFYGEKRLREVLKTVASASIWPRTRRLPWSATRTVWIRRCFRPSGGRG